MLIGIILFACFRLSLQDEWGIAVTNISVKEPLYLQSLAAEVMNLERGLARRTSMVGGAKDMVFRIESVHELESAQVQKYR